MKKGLVLEGGGLRALFSAGVTDVMMENQIKFDGLIGVSAGATFGCNYKSGQIGRALRYNIAFMIAGYLRMVSWKSGISLVRFLKKPLGWVNTTILRSKPNS